MMFIKGWNRKVTPLGRLYYQLAVSAHPIEETDCGLWLTPRANEVVEPAGQAAKRLGDRRPETACSLGEQAMNAALWPTVTTQDNDYCKSGNRKIKKLAGVVKEVSALWPTPQTFSIATETANISGSSDFTRKIDTAMGWRDHPNGKMKEERACLWPIPSARDHKDTPGMAKTSIDKDGSIRNRQDQLGRQVFGSTVQTENKGSLNPEFPCWLMGIPNEWVSSIVRGMQSLHKSQRNLSEQLCLEDMLT